MPKTNPLADSRAVLRALTREALASAVEGRPERYYERQVARDFLKGLPVGNYYHSQRFLKDVELLAWRCVRVANRSPRVLSDINNLFLIALRGIYIYISES